MRKRIILSIGLSVGVLGLSVAAAARHLDEVNGVIGGQLYDKWWEVAGLPAPDTDHPLYPDIGTKSGADTWRCKECHGWDYKGVDGAYGSGSHFTGIKGVFGSLMTPEEMFDLIKLDSVPNGHGYEATGLSDDDIWNMVEFLQGYLIDTDLYIDGTGNFIGDDDNGRWGYKAGGGYYSCIKCHGEDGTEINFGTELDPEYLADLATANPWEVIHKIRFGDAGAFMPAWILNGAGDQVASDMGVYLQASFPGPDYVGDEACSGCHANFPEADFYDGYKRSGHPYKLNRTFGVEPPVDLWPFSPVPPLPSTFGLELEWSDTEYVIGNYYWKARYIDPDGYIHTGAVDDKTQWNLATQEFVGYHAGESGKPYNCGRCHTTGYDSEGGNQLGLPGLIGTWTEDGVRCEACHGPAADHVSHPRDLLPEDGKPCSDCHYRDSQFRMPWKNGFMRHHQQSEDMSHSPHGGRLSCNNCHNPHRSTVYVDGGMTTHCSDCHEGNEANNFYVVPEMESVDCKDCHMPFMGKSATNANAYMGDIRGHIFQISTGTEMAADNVYEVDGNFYWNVDRRGKSYVTLDYACLGCHEEIGEPLTMQQAASFATNVHNRTVPGSGVRTGGKTMTKISR